MEWIVVHGTDEQPGGSWARFGRLAGVADEVELAAEWERLATAWDDPRAHQRFLALADASGALAEAGRRYRGVRDGDPARRAEAERRIEEILGRALARMKPERSDETRRLRSRVEWVGYGVSAALIAAALWQLFRLR